MAPGCGPRDAIPPPGRSWYPRANAGERRPSGRPRWTTGSPKHDAHSPPSPCPCSSPRSRPRRPRQPVPKLYVANSAGNDIHVIDTATNRVIKRVEVGPEPHGLVATADGDRIFITIENTRGDAGELLWFDPFYRHGDAADDDRPAPEPARVHARRVDRLHPLRRRLVVGRRHGQGRGRHEDRHGRPAAQHALLARRAGGCTWARRARTTS